MKINPYLIAPALAFSLVLFVSWGPEGHETVAQIAENHLSAKAKAEVARILGGTSMETAAIWADQVKKTPAWSYSRDWHFVNVDDHLSQQQFNQAVLSQDTTDRKNLNIYRAIVKCSRELQDSQTPAAARLADLKFIIHLVGDAHQPMHVSRKVDLGGGTIAVTLNGEATNLHSVWDSGLIDLDDGQLGIDKHSKTAYQAYGRALDKASSAQISQWQQDDILTWLYESYQISQQLYAEADQSHTLTDAYFNQHRAQLEERIDRGGIRLAGLLNQLFR